MNAKHYGTAADQQLQVFYVRAERSLTFLWEPHQWTCFRMACVSCFCEEGRKSRQLSSCRCRTTKRVYRSMKDHEERKLQKMCKNNWFFNLSFDIWGITVTCKAKNIRSFRLFVTNEKQCRTHRH